MKSANKDMADSLFFWGVARIYKYGKGVAAVDWKGVNEKNKQSMDKAATVLARKIVKRNGKVKPGIKTRGFFFIMHLMQRNGLNKRDVDYWKQKGWIGKKRPWK